MMNDIFVKDSKGGSELEWSLNYIDGELVSYRETGAGILVEAKSMKRRSIITYYIIPEEEGFWFSPVSERPLV